MSHDYWLSAVCTDPELGDELASAMAAEPGDEFAFSNGTKLYPVGTTFSRPTLRSPVQASNPSNARFVGVAATARGYALASEFLGPGPYPLLASRGLAADRIALIKECTVAEAGPRGTYEARVPTFLSSNGYTAFGVGA